MCEVKQTLAEVVFLGHVISIEGIYMDPKRWKLC
jgi:hypothetical protein